MPQPTLRQCLMDALVVMFERPPLDEKDVTFNRVSLDPLSENDQLDDDLALSISDIAERVREGVGWELRIVNVIFEFHAKVYEGDVAATVANSVIGAIQYRMGCDFYIDGTACNQTLIGSEIDIESATAKIARGVVSYDVTYRCAANDPFTAV